MHAVQLARQINPSLSIGPMAAPSVTAPILAACQEINVAEPGSEPDPKQPIPEDLTLLGDFMRSPSGALEQLSSAAACLLARLPACLLACTIA